MSFTHIFPVVGSSLTTILDGAHCRTCGRMRIKMNKKTLRHKGIHTVRGTYSTVYKDVNFSRSHPFASYAIIVAVLILVALLMVPVFFKTSSITIYNPDSNSWTKQITAYSSQMISEKKLSRQNIDLFKSNNYIVVVDCNYECIDIAYQYSDSNEWLVPGSFYLGNDQYSINAVPVTLNRSINAKYVTYRIEIYTDSGTETVYFSTKFQ